MENTLKFFPNLLKMNDHTVHFQSWDEAKAFYSQGDFRQCIHSVIKYININYANQGVGAGTNTYTFRHGSVQVFLRLTDTHYEIEAPFLRLPQPVPPALLRQVIEINFTGMSLAQIVLNETDGTLSLRYRDALELADPYKIHSLLREVCRTADYYDDLFVEKFKAELLNPVSSTPLPPEKLEACWNTFQSLIAETQDYLNYFEAKRYFGLLHDPLRLFVNRLSYSLTPQGYLRVLVGELAGALQSRSHPQEVYNEARRIFEKFKSLERTKFEASLYMTDLLLPDKGVFDNEGAKKFLESHLRTAAQERSNGDHISSSLTLLRGAYYYLDMMIGPPNVDHVIVGGLYGAGEKSWKETSDVLFQTFAQAHQMVEALSMQNQMLGAVNNIMNQLKSVVGQ